MTYYYSTATTVLSLQFDTLYTTLCWNELNFPFLLQLLSIKFSKSVHFIWVYGRNLGYFNLQARLLIIP